MSHYEDEAQVEQLKRWWSENWLPLLAGLGLGLAGIFGWEAWQGRETRVSEQASKMYEDLKAAAQAGRPEQVKELGGKLVADYAKTPYAAQASLLQAQAAADAREWDTAAGHLNWVVRNSDDDGLRALARLRLARVTWEQGKPDDALALLDADAGEFAALYEELRGDINFARGDRAAARAAYEKALAAETGPANREFLQRKLDDLADVAPVQS